MPESTNTGGRKPRVTDDDLLDVFRATADPVLSTAEVADAVPIKRRGTLNRLRDLEDSGRLDSKQIGGRNTVWWLLDDAGRSPANSDAVDGDVRGSVDTSLSDPSTDTAGESVTLPTEYDAEVRRAVDDVAEGWDDDDRLENRKRAALTVLQYALETGDGVGKSHPVIDAIREQYPVEGQNRETYWRKNLRDGVLKTYGEYSKGTHSYTVESLPSVDDGNDAQDSGVYDPTEEFDQ